MKRKLKFDIVSYLILFSLFSLLLVIVITVLSLFDTRTEVSITTSNLGKNLECRDVRIIDNEFLGSYHFETKCWIFINKNSETLSNDKQNNQELKGEQ